VTTQPVHFDRCVIVLYNVRKGKQSHIFNASKKTLTCLAFSGDGKHLVSGEVCTGFSDAFYPCYGVCC